MADKLISQLTAAAGSLADIDLMEGQKSGEVFSRKFTGLQMRQVEKGEREAQDDVIEASVGLNADGTFTAPVNSWGLRSIDFLAGCTDRAGATGALDENVMNALRLLDARLQSTGNGNISVLKAALNSDTTLTDIIPPGYMLQYVVFEEKTGNSPILDLGTTAGGNQVFINQALLPSDLTTISIGRTFSLVNSTTLYLNDDDAGSTWDSGVVDAYFIMTSVLPSGSVPTGVAVAGYYVGAYGLSAPPLEAEVEAIIGLPTDYTAGSLFIINDTTPMAESIFFYMTDGSDWYYNSANFEEAL